MTKTKIAELLTVFRCQWPRDWPQDRQTFENDIRVLFNSYEDGLSDIPDEDYEKTLSAILKVCKYRPVPALVIEIWTSATGHSVEKIEERKRAALNLIRTSEEIANANKERQRPTDVTAIESTKLNLNEYIKKYFWNK